jgi:hypothetical protein
MLDIHPSMVIGVAWWILNQFLFVIWLFLLENIGDCFSKLTSPLYFQVKKDQNHFLLSVSSTVGQKSCPDHRFLQWIVHKKIFDHLIFFLCWIMISTLSLKKFQLHLFIIVAKTFQVKKTKTFLILHSCFERSSKHIWKQHFLNFNCYHVYFNIVFMNETSTILTLEHSKKS